MNITEFLLARIAEDEALADDMFGVKISPEGGAVNIAWRPVTNVMPPNLTQMYAHVDGGATLTFTLHPAPHMLRAECAAKRAIVDEHELVPQTYENRRTPTHDVGCNLCAEWDGLITPDGPCRTLRFLAAVYADHPDYDQAWRV